MLDKWDVLKRSIQKQEKLLFDKARAADNFAEKSYFYAAIQGIYSVNNLMNVIDEKAKNF